MVLVVSKTPTLESVAAKTPMVPLLQEAAVAPRLYSNAVRGLLKDGLCLHLHNVRLKMYIQLALKRLLFTSNINMYTGTPLEKILLGYHAYFFFALSLFIGLRRLNQCHPT